MAKTDSDSEGCLICGSKHGRINRGLCTSHYLKMRRQMLRLNEAGQAELERLLIADGKLLPAKPGKRPGAENPFEVVAEILIAEHPEFEYQVKPLDDPDPKELLENARRKKKRSD